MSLDAEKNFVRFTYIYELVFLGNLLWLVKVFKKAIGYPSLIHHFRADSYNLPCVPLEC